MRGSQGRAAVVSLAGLTREAHRTGPKRSPLDAGPARVLGRSGSTPRGTTMKKPRTRGPDGYRVAGTGRAAFFESRDVHPRDCVRRWVVYWHGKPVAVKRLTYHYSPRWRGPVMSTSETEFVLLTPVARWLGGDPKARPAQELYRAAVAADEVFQRALEARFGKNAGDARYRKLPEDIEPLAREFQQAMGAYWACCENFKGETRGRDTDPSRGDPSRVPE